MPTPPASKNTIRPIIICGPTGSGKSELGMRLAERYGGRIISADSRQIYRRLDIGTAKPSREDRARIPHYMIDIVDVIDDFTAKKYAEMASDAIVDTISADAIPFIVGGAGLYLAALTEGLFEGPEKDKAIRKELEHIVLEKGPEWLHDELARVDPEAAARITPHDSVRLVRALEVYRLTGKPLSRLQASGEYRRLPASCLWIGITYERSKLYRRIDMRVDRMIEDGLRDEIKDLLRSGLGNPIIEKRIVGYYEIIEAMEKNLSLDRAIASVKQHSRNYAKRQLTWFRNKAMVNWISPDSASSSDKLLRLIDKHLYKRA
jgi:tRNA dimethylallyltransferase